MIAESLMAVRFTARQNLLRNMVLFARLLRGAGIDVTPDQIIDWVAATGHIDFHSRIDFKNASRAVLVGCHEQLELFDHAFDLFWRDRAEDQWARSGLAKPRQAGDNEDSEPRQLADTGGLRQPPIESAEEPEAEAARTYSDQDVLRHKDFASLEPAELDAVRHLMLAIRWDLEERHTRRKIRAPHGAYLDLRQAMRDSLRNGCEPLQLAWRRRKPKRRPVVVLCDISGSMERYSRILLQFVYAVSQGLRTVEAFAFGTRLTRITRHLREADVDAALGCAAAAVNDWAGGTRIGESLKAFNYLWGRRVLSHGAVVLIISDGWDRGDMALLADEMERLQLSCQRLIWLNPLLGAPDYQPLVRGIQTALPYVDDFLPVHNLASLEQLGALLQQAGEVRPLRKQHSHPELAGSLGPRQGC